MSTILCRVEREESQGSGTFSFHCGVKNFQHWFSNVPKVIFYMSRLSNRYSVSLFRVFRDFIKINIYILYKVDGKRQNLQFYGVKHQALFLLLFDSAAPFASVLNLSCYSHGNIKYTPISVYLLA